MIQLSVANRIIDIFPVDSLLPGAKHSHGIGSDSSVCPLFPEVFIMGVFFIAATPPAANPPLPSERTHRRKNTDFLDLCGINSFQRFIQLIQQQKPAVLHTVDIQIQFRIIALFPQEYQRNKAGNKGYSQQNAQACKNSIQKGVLEQPQNNQNTKENSKANRRTVLYNVVILPNPAPRFCNPVHLPLAFL
ncbi:MAG: hypothetical protein J6J78_11760 [Clostridia bacterium]|nr:hypothetical protein [Clostridia bacterium]